MKLNIFAFSISAAIVAALMMLTLGIMANMGIYLGAAEMMEDVHLYFDLTAIGIIIGMIEAAIMGFIVGLIFGFIYNRLA
jgi:hypothetical protein